jgi:hypothetical protein
MAITSFLILKLSEDDDSVVYGYGDGPESIEGTVEFDKDTTEVLRKSEDSSRSQIVSGFMPFRRRKTGSWPHHHTFAA